MERKKENKKPFLGFVEDPKKECCMLLKIGLQEGGSVSVVEEAPLIRGPTLNNGHLFKIRYIQELNFVPVI